MKDSPQALFVILIGAVFPGVGLSQERVKPVTVCEVFNNLKTHGNSVVAIVGRMEIMGSLIDHYEYVSQDHCEKPITTQGHGWPTKILIWAHHEEGFPEPPTDEPELDHAVLAEKLSDVRKTTNLGVHHEYQLNKQSVPIAVPVSNNWVVVYGRTFMSPHLTKDSCEGIGCRGFIGAPMTIIVDPKNVRILNDDGTLASSKH